MAQRYNKLLNRANRYGEQDDAKELAQEENAAFAQKSLYLVGGLDDDKDPHHVDGKANEDVHVGIHRLERNQCGEHSGASNEREHHGDDGGSTARGVVLENLHVENHLERHEKHQEPTSGGKRLDVAVENLEDPVAAIVEAHHQDGGVDGGFPGIDFAPFGAQVHYNGHRAHYVDDAEQH